MDFNLQYTYNTVNMNPVFSMGFTYQRDSHGFCLYPDTVCTKKRIIKMHPLNRVYLLVDFWIVTNGLNFHRLLLQEYHELITE